MKRQVVPGWAAIIPIYNLVVLLEITDKELWWLLLFFIPFVNIYAAWKIWSGLAEKFGQDIGFALGLFFLNSDFHAYFGLRRLSIHGTQSKAQSLLIIIRIQEARGLVLSPSLPCL